MPPRRTTLVALLAAGLVCLQIGACSLVGPTTYQVGQSHSLKLPSEAAAKVLSGDSVVIDPGEYTDCAVWRAPHLTIAGSGPGVVIRDKTCQGKAIFVTVGSDITIRDITFTGAHVTDRNGAGIRAEGANLTVENSRFIDNDEGILAGSTRGSKIRIIDSEFRGNGNCDQACAHGIYVGVIAFLDIEHSRFSATHVGHDIKSRALHTVLIDNRIIDGPDGDSSYLVDLPNGGNLRMEDNVLEKGPRTNNDSTAVSIGAEGVTNPTDELLVQRNRFTNLLPASTIFIRNQTKTPVQMNDNKMTGKVVALSGPGQ